MAKVLEASIYINSEQVFPNSGYQVTITQGVNNHHHFSLIFPANTTEGFAGVLMENSIAYIGKKMSIGLDEGAFEFTGIITEISLEKNNGATGTIVVSGYSPTILLSHSIQCLSYDEGTSLNQIASDTCEGHSTELLSVNYGNLSDITLPYTVQYNENDFSFLQRLCIKNGVWLYYNGTELCVGRTGENQVNGTYGQDIETFGVRAQLKEQAFNIKHYDWINNQPLESDSSAYAPGGENTFANTAKNESDSIFQKKGSYFNNALDSVYSGQAGLDTNTKVATLGRASGMLVATGITEIPNLRVGDTLTVEGLNFTDANSRDAYGSYMITSITHHIDHSGKYHNSFEGLPDNTEHPPYSNPFEVPFAESQRAIVMDNADPEGLGRIQVQFPWQQERNTVSPWIKMATPYAGSSKGFYFIPEIEEEVLVGFEGGNPEKPYVLSAGYNQVAKSEVNNTDNNIKSIKTRSGHTIELDDTDGAEKINIFDKEGSIITFDTAEKSIYISVAENIKLAANNIEIIAEQNIDIKANGEITIAAEGNLSALTQAELALQSESDTTINSNGGITAQATADLSLSGQNIIAEGESAAELKGAQTKIEGSAMTDISGGIVKIN